jgi:hypothetical protein
MWERNARGGAADDGGASHLLWPVLIPAINTDHRSHGMTRRVEALAMFNNQLVSVQAGCGP